MPTTGSSHARSTGGGDAPWRREVERPDHLVMWPRAHVDRRDDEAIDRSELLDDSFSLSHWVQETQREHPGAVLAAAFPSVVPHPDGHTLRRIETDWLDLVTVAAGLSGGPADRSFIGDTTPTSLRALRQWAHERLDQHEFSAEDVVLALSELAANVEVHAGPWLIVDVVDRGHAVVLAVTDPFVGGLPLLRRPDVHEDSGRGLFVVASVAHRWGVVVRPRSKSVWAAFARP